MAPGLWGQRPPAPPHCRPGCRGHLWGGGRPGPGGPSGPWGGGPRAVSASGGKPTPPTPALLIPVLLADPHSDWWGRAACLQGCRAAGGGSGESRLEGTRSRGSQDLDLAPGPRRDCACLGPESPRVRGPGRSEALLGRSRRDMGKGGLLPRCLAPTVACSRPRRPAPDTTRSSLSAPRPTQSWVRDGSALALRRAVGALT